MDLNEVFEELIKDETDKVFKLNADLITATFRKELKQLYKRIHDLEIRVGELEGESSPITLHETWQDGIADHWRVVGQFTPVVSNGLAAFLMSYDERYTKGHEQHIEPAMELRQNEHPHHFNINQEYWMGFRFYLPDDFMVIDRGVTMQQMYQYGKGMQLNPPMALKIEQANELRLLVRGDSKRKPQKGNYMTSESYSLGILESGWHTVIYNIHFSWDENQGKTCVWLDDEMMVNHRDRNCYNLRNEKGEPIHPFWKHGLYVPHWRREKSADSSFSLSFGSIVIADDKADYDTVKDMLNNE